MTPPITACDWVEDFDHENGQYQNRCSECEQLFTGHKRRFVCKRCEFAALRSKLERYDKLLTSTNLTFMADGRGLVQLDGKWLSTTDKLSGPVYDTALDAFEAEQEGE